MSKLFPVIFAILISACSSVASSTRNQSLSCVSRSCGGVNISYPFRLSTDPANCGHPDSSFHLHCVENQAIWGSNNPNSYNYKVISISYTNYSILITELDSVRRNYSTCPLYLQFSSPYMYGVSQSLTYITLVDCQKPVMNPLYIPNRFCETTSSMNFSYLLVGNLQGFKLEDYCVEQYSTIYVSAKLLDETKINGSYSWETIHDYITGETQLNWYRGTLFCSKCKNSKGSCLLHHPTNELSCSHTCYEDTPFKERSLWCKIEFYGGYIYLVGIIIGSLIGLRFIVGVLFVVVFVICKRRRKKLSAT